MPDYRSQLVASDLVGVTGVTQTPPQGTACSPGIVAVSLVANDASDNASVAVIFDVTFIASDIVLDPGFNPNANSYLLSTAVQPDGKIVIGGVFSTVGGAAHNLIARIHADGSLDPSFNPAVAGSQIHSIAVQADGKVLIAGYFSSVGGAARSDFARLNADGTLDTGFNPNTDSWPSCITVQGDGKIIIGGYFSNVGGAAHNKIARLNPDGTPDTGFNPAANGTVYSATVQDDGKIVIVGAFGSVNGTARPHVARLNADGTLDASFNPGANGPVYISALQVDGKIVISGSFSTMGGTTRNQIARLNADGTVDSGFDPNMNAAAETAVVQADGKILIGGSFTTVGGTARRYLARLDTNGTLDNSFEPNVNNLVYSTELLADGTILFGGRFTSVDGTTRNQIARVLNSPATQTLTVASPARVEWQRGGTSPETTQVSFELSTDGTTWTMLGTGTRISGGWELTGLSLPANGTLRAHARTGGGYRTGSSGLVESLQSFTFNTPPIADAGADQAIQLGSTAYLDGTASTDDLTPDSGLVYAWTIESAPAGSTADLSGTDTSTPALVPDLAGDYTVKLTVTDAGGLQGTDEIAVTASAVIGNGSFEDGFAGWVPSGNVSLQSGGMYTSTDGTKLVAFNAMNSPPNGVLSRSFTTVPGQAYQLEFDAGVLAYNRNQQRLGVTVVGGGQLMSDTITLTGLGGGMILWVAKSYLFTADSATSTVIFRDLSTTTDSLDLLLDHVRITSAVKALLVTSIPDIGVAVGVTPLDTLGAGDGNTTFTREYNPGTVVDLAAPAEAGGGTFYQWWKNGAEFSTDPSIQITMNGDHQMTAVYWSGAPVITVQPVGMTAVFGGTASFSVTSSGAPVLTYQWRFNGSDIPGAVDPVLTIDAVEVGDAGDYDVVVSNGLGSVTSDPAALAVQSVILANPSFELDYQGWTVSGSQGIRSSLPYVASDGAKLVAFNVGNFPANGVLSQSFPTTPGVAYLVSFDMGVLAYNTSEQRLQMELSGSPIFVSETFSMRGIGGGKVLWETKSLAFTADSATTTLTFRDRSPTSNALDLLLDNVRVVARVTRTLAVETNLSQDGMDPRLVVAVSPADSSGKSDGSPPFSRSYVDAPAVDLTAPAVFSTMYRIDFPFIFQFQKWLKDGVEFATSPATRVTTDGDYTLTAVYRVHPPFITKQPEDDVTGAEGSALFSVEPGYFAGWEYQWRFNGVDIAGATDSSYQIDNVGGDDAGTYDVVVSNVTGTITSEPATLTVVANSLVNGSFEYYYQGWNYSGNLGIRTTAPPYAASDGSKLVGFNAGNSTPNGILSQTFVTTPGITYLLSFDMGVVAYNTNEQRLQVELSGSPAFFSETYAMRGIGGGKTVWSTKNITFTADSTATIVTFKDVSTTTIALDLLLDNVRLEAAPEGFSLIPTGTFQMGDTFAEGADDERPVHTVQTSAFYMAKHEVTKALWDEVKTWGVSHGYTDLPAGGGKATNHPVQTINWYDMVKWCNARSEKEGLTPCYTVFGAVYRTGSTAPDCNWSASGYRLPTEAEWEKAARGGLSGKRFPWGDTISHSLANYYVYSSNGTTNYYSYDVSSTRGYHPTYGIGSSPYTSPVGSFAANGYGLHDMAGDVWESCWDWYGGYSSAPQTDPRGAASGSNSNPLRIIRGGDWEDNRYGAYRCRTAERHYCAPTYFGNSIGFRLARSSVP